ncbi:hypothetical protein QTP88_025658 [Uroleucon formosanum]
MKEYEDLKHMTKVELCSNIKESYYLPHHAVWREDSVTTKFRVMFNVSCKTTSGVSLNDVLLKGPCIQEDLIHLLIRFHAPIEAFGACLYLKTTNNQGKSSSRLICAKSHVASLKSISLPRLELYGAVLLARLADKIIAKLKMNISQRTFWTDSSIVLAWISSPSAQWKTFVAHRVGEIQEITSTSEWACLDTKDNLADIISRGREPQMM